MTNYSPLNDELKLQLEDSFDALAVEELRQEFEQLVAQELDVVLDFKRVTFIDSSGLGAIVFLFKRLRALDRNLKLVNTTGQPLQLLQYLRIDKVIDMTDCDGDNNE
jgi:anti-anti-sigma factor